MRFAEAFEQMKAGNPVKLPSWGGYWAWDEEKQTIMMHFTNWNTTGIQQRNELKKSKSPSLKVRF